MPVLLIAFVASYWVGYERIVITRQPTPTGLIRVQRMLFVGFASVARQRLEDHQLWVNPDCGLKTRGWPETKAALINMVEAAKRLRETA